MKLPRGFGKNYFTLRAITATVNQVTMHAQCSRVQSFHMTHFASDELEAETVSTGNVYVAVPAVNNC